MLVSTITLLLRFSVLVESLSCLDDKENPVDWFVGYKLPDGFKYVYLNPDASEWKLSENLISENGMMKNTFEQMFLLKNSTSALYGMYNDEKPPVPSVDADAHTWGHLKGAIAFDNSSGFWIIHSIPKLPDDPDHYRYPSTGRIYGQHMLCVTLSSAYMLPVVEQLMISRPQFLSTYLSPDWVEKYPEIAFMFNNKRNVTVSNKTIILETAGNGLKMRHFSKSDTFGKDLYQDLVSPNLGLGLKVETWRHGSSEPSVCRNGQPWIVNVQNLRFTQPAISFNSFQDHSKWACTVPLQSGELNPDMWVCLGDINRMFSQFHRGGGTMCIQNKRMWEAFSNLIVQVEECSEDCSEEAGHLCSEL
ncbi:Deoxyribonuclease-2-alpha [Fasciola gigantica]|uniref:Deoxyribonuclease-2-alpha n=1 Tax=Fasciola gigantica TaxID=46835 RepID=A0A504Z2W4_FASGI|nr:Deoxyribonuclease-2-alpha [Fasciola gigantica]